VAFRATVYATLDGKIITGLERAREGKVVVLADAQGEEIRIAESDLEESHRSDLSLMPAGIADSIEQRDLHDLLAWLLANRQAAPASTPNE